MTIRVLIKRHVKEGFVGRASEMLHEFPQKAKKQPGYISGGTWINHYDPRSITIVSSWQRLEDWIRWQSSDERAANEAKIEGLLEAWLIFAVSCALGFVLSYAASNTAAALIACPIAATLAIGAEISYIPPIIGAALACSISSAIPSTTPPMAIVYSSGHVKIWTMFKVGIISDLIRLSALIAMGPFLIEFVF